MLLFLWKTAYSLWMILNSIVNSWCVNNRGEALAGKASPSTTVMSSQIKSTSPPAAFSCRQWAAVRMCLQNYKNFSSRKSPYNRTGRSEQPSFFYKLFVENCEFEHIRKILSYPSLFRPAGTVEDLTCRWWVPRHTWRGNFPWWSLEAAANSRETHFCQLNLLQWL